MKRALAPISKLPASALLRSALLCSQTVSQSVTSFPPPTPREGRPTKPVLGREDSGLAAAAKSHSYFFPPWSELFAYYQEIRRLKFKIAAARYLPPPRIERLCLAKRRTRPSGPAPPSACQQRGGGGGSRQRRLSARDSGRHCDLGAPTSPAASRFALEEKLNFLISSSQQTNKERTNKEQTSKQRTKGKEQARENFSKASRTNFRAYDLPTLR